MAEIGWIDFSPKDRNRVGSVLDLLKPEGQVDELGIGTIRDALADRLFPGISTIQTRAKYFFIIPYILQDFLALPIKERKKTKPTDYLEQHEHEIMWALGDIYNHEEGCGVIGISKRKPEKIVRRPSEIYWNGLNTFGCINSGRLSAAAFLNSANKANNETLLHTGEDESDDIDAGFENYFKVKVPRNKRWRDNLSLDLTAKEASFLYDAMLDKTESVLPLIIANDELYGIFIRSHAFNDFAKQSYLEIKDPQIKKDLVLAHDFAIIMEGAHIAYNQELQKQFCSQDNFLNDWVNWKESFKQQMLNYEEFNPENLFVYAKTTKPFTANFVRNWCELIKRKTINEQKKIALIKQQESFAKGKKARLKYNKAIDVKENKRIGLGMLQYRFRNVQVIIKDVKEGLKGNA